MTAGRRTRLRILASSGAASVAGRSALAQAIALPLAAVCSILVTRILITELGTSSFAAVSLVVGLFLLLPFLDVGAYTEIANSVSDVTATGWTPQLRRRLLTAFRTLTVSAAAVVVIAIVGYLLGWARILGAPGVDAEAVNKLTLMVLLIFAIVIFCNSGVMVLRGQGLQWLAVVFAAAAWPLGLALLLVLRSTGVDGLALGVAMPTAILLTSGTGLVLSLRLLRVRLSRASIRTLASPRAQPGASIRSVALPSLLITVGVAVGTQSDRYLLAHFSSAAAVASYIVAYQGFAAAISVAAVAGSSLWPVLRRHARSDGASLTSRYRRGVAAGLLLGLALAAGYCLVMPPVYRFITGGTVSTALILAFAVLIVVQSAIFVPVGYLSDAPQLRLRSLLVWASVAVGLPLSAYLSWSWGAPGPVWGSAIALTACQLLPLLYLARRFRVPAQTDEKPTEPAVTSESPRRVTQEL